MATWNQKGDTMNFIFISPNFPHTYWQFCDRLKKKGVNVLGIGDCSYDGLEPELKASLTEYYKVDSMLLPSDIHGMDVPYGSSSPAK